MQLKQRLKPGLYIILDDAPYDELVQRGKRFLGLPLSAIQIRAKSLTKRDRINLAREFKRILATRPVTDRPQLIVNDDVELAKRLEMAVHLGQMDCSIEAARRDLGPQTVIGISTHTLDQALKAQEAGADYIGLGPIYETQTKKNALTPRSKEQIEQIIQNISIPIVAIGGLTPDNVDPLIAQGLQILSMISALGNKKYTHPDWLKVTQKLSRTKT